MTEESVHPSLSIVILCYRSEEAVISFVEKVVRELDEGGIIDYELVLVANYHADVPDITPDVVRKLSVENSRITSVIYEKEGMMGWDVIKGLDAATGESIALIDGGGQMPPRDIVRVYRVLQNGRHDFVKTYRTKRYDEMMRIFLSDTYNTVFRVVFLRILYRDIISKPKIWTRSALNKLDLQCKGWFSDGEMVLEAYRLHFSTEEIPTVFQENEWRGSFDGTLTIFEMMLSIIWYRFVYWFKI